VVPETEAQTLQAADKHMAEDVTIYRVSPE